MLSSRLCKRPVVAWLWERSVLSTLVLARFLAKMKDRKGCDKEKQRSRCPALTHRLMGQCLPDRDAPEAWEAKRVRRKGVWIVTNKQDQTREVGETATNEVWSLKQRGQGLPDRRKKLSEVQQRRRTRYSVLTTISWEGWWIFWASSLHLSFFDVSSVAYRFSRPHSLLWLVQPTTNHDVRSNEANEPLVGTLVGAAPTEVTSC